MTLRNKTTQCYGEDLQEKIQRPEDTQGLICGETHCAWVYTYTHTHTDTLISGGKWAARLQRTHTEYKSSLCSLKHSQGYTQRWALGEAQQCAPVLHHWFKETLSIIFDCTHVSLYCIHSLAPVFERRPVGVLPERFIPQKHASLSAGGSTDRRVWLHSQTEIKDVDNIKQEFEDSSKD